MFSTVELTVAAHDTTGGMKTKIAEAAMIAKLGIDVYIVKVLFFLLHLICLSFYPRAPNDESCCCISGSNKPLIKGLKWRSEKQHP